MSAACFVEAPHGSLLVTGDAGGRLFVSPVSGDSTITPQRLDKLATESANAFASCHKYHPIVCLEQSTYNPSLFLAVSANGRLSLWEADGASLSPRLGMILNYNVEESSSAWVPIVPVGTASDTIALASFSPAQPNIIVCSVCAPHPMLAFFCFETRTLLRAVAVHTPVTRLTPIWLGNQRETDLSFVAASNASGSIALVSAHEDALGSVSAIIPAFTAVSPCTSLIATVSDGKAPVANIVTSQGASVNVWKVDA